MASASKEKARVESNKRWEPSAQECKEIIAGEHAQQWEDNDKKKIHSLFAQYPHNTKIEEVRKKAKVLDNIYSTQIHRFNPGKGIEIVAYRICSIPSFVKENRKKI